MNTTVNQMIDDAKATLEASLASDQNLASNDVRLSLDPPPWVGPFGSSSNYRGYTLLEHDMLVVSLPHEHHACKFELVIITHFASLRSQTFVVLPDGKLYEAADPKRPDYQLVEVNPETAAELAAQINSAVPTS